MLDKVSTFSWLEGRLEICSRLCKKGLRKAIWFSNFQALFLVAPCPLLELFHFFLAFL
jgi:hypothetical protein